MLHHARIMRAMRSPCLQIELILWTLTSFACRDRSPKRGDVAAEARPTLTGFSGGLNIQDNSPLHLHNRSNLDPDVVHSASDSSALRKTKIVCTIGPTSCSREDLFKLADEVSVCQTGPTGSVLHVKAFQDVIAHCPIGNLLPCSALQTLPLSHTSAE